MNTGIGALEYRVGRKGLENGGKMKYLGEGNDKNILIA